MQMFLNDTGSSSTSSTKSGTMELYTTSSYNDTMSADGDPGSNGMNGGGSANGGETLSSVSENGSGLGGQCGHPQPPMVITTDYPHHHAASPAMTAYLVRRQSVYLPTILNSPRHAHQHHEISIDMFVSSRKTTTPTAAAHT